MSRKVFSDPRKCVACGRYFESRLGCKCDPKEKKPPKREPPTVEQRLEDGFDMLTQCEKDEE